MKTNDAKDPTLISERSLSRVKCHLRTQDAGSSRRSYRIGVPAQYNIAELEPAIRETWLRTLQKLQGLGHHIHPVSLPTTEVALSAYYVIAAAEASSNLAKYDGARYGNRNLHDKRSSHVLYADTRGAGLGKEVKRRIILGSFSLSAGAIDNYFIKAQKVRRLVQEDFNKVFRLDHPLLPPRDRDTKDGNGVDYLITPTSPSFPPTLESVASRNPVDTFADDVLTVPASLAGLPAVTVPVPVDPISNSDPTKPSTVGMQVIGQYGCDDGVLAIGHLLELEVGQYSQANKVGES